MERTWIVVGERVGLTALVRDEFLDRWDLYNEPELGMLLSFPTTTTSVAGPAKPPVTRENRERLWELIVARELLGFEIRTVGDQRCVGECSLSRITWPRGSAEIAVAVFDPADRGRGYGSEAVTLMTAYGFDGCGLHRVTMRYLAVNDAAVRACEREAEAAGGRIVGVEREAEWAFGARQDCLIMEVLRSDFPPHPATAHLRAATPLPLAEGAVPD
jgi:RimJ/RimL family protein N-acetyltransferase